MQARPWMRTCTYESYLGPSSASRPSEHPHTRLTLLGSPPDVVPLHKHPKGQSLNVRVKTLHMKHILLQGLRSHREAGLQRQETAILPT